MYLSISLMCRGFSLYFLAHTTEEQEKELEALRKDASLEAREKMSTLPSTWFQPVLELTHNHGTENKPDFS
jgi:hypothetical protein